MKKEPLSVQNQREIKKKAPRGKPFEKGNTVGFKPGESGNPGGCPKGTPKVSIAYMSLLSMSPAEVGKFVPQTLAELLAYRQVRRALELDGVGVKDAISATERIIDRAEGKPMQRSELTGKDGQPLFDEQAKVERAIAEFMKETGGNRADAIKHLGLFMPQVNDYKM